MTTTVAFLGLGLMGSRMARSLAAKGFAVRGWNRSPGKAVDGVEMCGTIAEAVAGAEVACVCVADPFAVRSVVLGKEGVLAAAAAPGLVIDFSTIDPACAREVDAACRARGLRFVEAPVTGSKLGAERGSLVIMAGGAEEDLARAEPIFHAVGERWFRCGPVGAGSQVKLGGNVVIAGMLEALAEGMVACAKAGVDASVLIDVIQASGFRSPYWDFKGRAMLQSEPELHFAASLMHKDLDLFVRRAEALGVPAPSAERLREVYALALRADLGEKDIAAVVQVLEVAAGVSVASPVVGGVV